METVTDLSLREIGVAASKVLGRPVEVRAESHIGRDLAVDSLALMNIIMELEDVYHLRISDEDAAHIRTVGDAVQYILTHGGKNAA